MVRLAADENFNYHIVRGLRRRNPALDIVRIQDTDLYGEEDPAVLAWCAQENRILMTHDAATMTHYAYERVAAGARMPGVVQVGPSLPVARAINDLLLLSEVSVEDEWQGQVIYLPLR